VSGFDVGLVGVSGRGDGLMEEAWGCLEGAGEGASVFGVPRADELRAVVGLEAGLGEVQAAEF